MTEVSSTSKKPAPDAPDFVPFHHSQSSDAEVKVTNETLGILLEAFDLTIHLPDGSTTVTSVDPSKPMMDLQIKICAQLKLNPADYTLQVFPPDNNNWPISYKANQTFASIGVHNTVKLSPKRTEKDKQKQNPQQPFEITQRVIVSLPNNQKFVMRVRPDISLSELFKAATAQKDLDPQRYRLCHPTNSKMILNMEYPLNFYGISEIYLAYVGVNRMNGSMISNSDRTKLGPNLQTIPAPDTAIRQTEVSKSSWNLSNGHTMQRNASETNSKSTELPPGTNSERKKGFLSFLKRKKSGKFSFGSMQNLHQIDGSSTLSLPKKSQEYPVASELQSHRKSLPTSELNQNTAKGITTESVVAYQISATVAAGPKKRPAPQPPALSLPLKVISGNQPTTPLCISSQTQLINDEAKSQRRSTPESSETNSDSFEIEKSTNGSKKLFNGSRHSPASSQSSGFEEMSPSPSEDYKRPDLTVSRSTVNEPSGFSVKDSGSLPNSDFTVPRPAPRTKRKAPAPPAMNQPSANTTSATVNSKTTSSANVLTSQSLNGPVKSISPANSDHSVDAQRRILNQDGSHFVAKEEVDEEIGTVHSYSGAQSGVNRIGVAASVKTPIQAEARTGGIVNEMNKPETIAARSNYGPGASDDEDLIAAAEEEGDDCFCEMDAGYDGEIDFDSVDIVFVTPEIAQSRKSTSKPLNTDFGLKDTSADFQSVSFDASNKQIISTLDKKTNSKDDETGTTGAVTSSFQNTSGPTAIESCSLKQMPQDLNSPISDSRPSCSNLGAEIAYSEKKVIKPSTIEPSPMDEAEHLKTLSGNTNNCSLSIRTLNFVSNLGATGCDGSFMKNTPGAVNSNLVQPPNNFLDHFKDAHQFSDVCDDFQVSDRSRGTREEKPSEMPQTIIIDKSEVSHAGSKSDFHVSSDLCRESSLEHEQPKEKDESGKSCAREESFDPSSRSIISDETREKLSSDSFLIDRSACRRFYPSVVQSSESPSENRSTAEDLIGALPNEIIGENSLKSGTTFKEDSQSNSKEAVICAKETSKLQTNAGISSLRELKSKPDNTKKSLYQLIRGSAGSGVTSIQTNSTKESLDVHQNECKVEPQRDKVAEPQSPGTTPQSPGTTPQSPGTTFAVDLQRHLSRWQQQHGNHANESSNNSNAPVIPAQGKPTPNVMDVVAGKYDAKLELKQGGETLQNSLDHHKSGVGSSSRPAGGPMVNSGVGSGAKQFSKSDVVFTMDQLLAARSALKKSASTEPRREFPNIGAIPKPAVPSGAVNSSRSFITVSSSTVIPRPVSTSAVQNVVRTETSTVPSPPPLALPRKEKWNGCVEKLALQATSKPSEQVDLHDQLLVAIRNAAGRPVRCKSTL